MLQQQVIRIFLTNPLLFLFIFLTYMIKVLIKNKFFEWILLE